MAKYETKYEVLLSLRSYFTQTDKYSMGDFTTIKDLENIKFETVLEDLNKRLINMDFLKTDLFLEINEEDARSILDSYTDNDLVEDIRIPGLLNIKISDEKVNQWELDEFLQGVIEIVKDQNSKVLALGYKIDLFGNFKLLAEDKKHDGSVIIEFTVVKLKEKK